MRILTPVLCGAAAATAVVVLFSDGRWVFWMLAVIPLAVALVGKGIQHAREVSAARLGRCARCGYDLRATPGRCPECGKVPARPPNVRPIPRPMELRPQDERWMREAMELARAAAAAGEVPIGAIVVHDPTQTVVGRGFNRRLLDHDPTAHAEILALREAGRSLGQWRLLDCTLYVTLEPCPMCAGAAVNSRLPRLVYGCDDPKAGAVSTLFQLCQDARLNHRVDVRGGVLADECAELLRAFFREQRSRGKK